MALFPDEPLTVYSPQTYWFVKSYLAASSCGPNTFPGTRNPEPVWIEKDDEWYDHRILITNYNDFDYKCDVCNEIDKNKLLYVTTRLINWKTYRFQKRVFEPLIELACYKCFEKPYIVRKKPSYDESFARCYISSATWGLPEDIETCLCLFRLRDTYWRKLPTDIFKLILQHLVIIERMEEHSYCDAGSHDTDQCKYRDMWHDFIDHYSDYKKTE